MIRVKMREDQKIDSRKALIQQKLMRYRAGIFTAGASAVDHSDMAACVYHNALTLPYV
jgi:hypothetical protein